MNSNHYSTSPNPLGPSRQCAAYADLLPVLDEPETEASAAAAVRAHLATCIYCQDRLRQYAQLDATIARAVGPAATPRRSTEDIMRDVLSEDVTQTETLHTMTAGATPTPVPIGATRSRGPLLPHVTSGSRRQWSGLASLAAVLAVALLAAILLAGHVRGGGPGAKATPAPDWGGPGSQTTLSGISMVSSTEGWAVGSAFPANDTNGNQARVLLMHYKNGAWSSMRLAISGQVNSISMVSTNDGWAVGDNGLMLHYDGTTWREVASPTERSFAQVQMLSATDGWAVANAFDIYHYDGHTWIAQPLPTNLGGVTPFIVEIAALSMLSPTDGWAIGTYPSTGTAPPSRSSVVILRYHNGVWAVDDTIAATGSQSLAVQSLSMSSDTEGWATGSINADVSGSQPVQDMPLLLHYMDGAWHQVADPLTGMSYHPIAFTQVAMRSAADGWITVSQGSPASTPLLLRYDGAHWNVVALPNLLHSAEWYLTGLAFTPAGELWAIGVRLSDATTGAPDGHGGFTPTITPVILHEQHGIWSVVMQ